MPARSRLLVVLLLLLPLSSGTQLAGTSESSDSSDPCSEPGLEVAAVTEDGVALCGHTYDDSPEEVLPPVDPSDQVMAAAIAATGATCVGDGNSNKRIVVLYGWWEHTSNSFGAPIDAAIRDRIALADTFLAKSAGSVVLDEERHVLYQHFRWRCNSTKQVMIQTIKIRDFNQNLPPADETFEFSDLVASMEAAGHTREDRIYLVFGDHLRGFSPGGYADFPWDDSTGPENASNSGPHYAVVSVDSSPNGGELNGDSGGTTTFHEIGHMMGAVSYNAPHRDVQGGHCTDGYDVMCKDTYTHLPCGAVQSRRYDCRDDDYHSGMCAFRPELCSEPGNYWLTHWNIANNQFATRVQAVQDDPQDALGLFLLDGDGDDCLPVIAECPEDTMYFTRSRL